MGQHWSHLTPTKRIQLDAFIRAGMKPTDIAKELGVHHTTIYRELKRCTYEHLNSDYTTETRYNPEGAQARYEANLRAKGPELKIGNDYELADYLIAKIRDEKYSPEAAIGEAEVKGWPFKTHICASTAYNYIHGEIFGDELTVSMLPQHGKRHRRIGQAQPLGPEAHLRHRLFAGDIDDARAFAGQRRRRLDEQGRLADTGIATDQESGAAHEAAARDAVELGNARFEARGLGDLARELHQRNDAPLAHRPALLTENGRTDTDAAGDLLDEGIPGPARLALAHPARTDGAAGLADELNGALGHDVSGTTPPFAIIAERVDEP